MKNEVRVPIRCDFWVSQNTYRWASQRWPSHQLWIDNYLPDNIIEARRPGYTVNSKLKRKIRIPSEMMEQEKQKWFEWFTTPKLLRKYIK